MEHLIIISEQNGKSVVSARDLWYFLEIKTDFTNWCKRMFEYGFIEGVDFSLILIENNGERFSPNLAKTSGGRPSSDYALTLDCAKEISMIQRSEKGKQAREYFIACEKKLQSLSQPTLEEMTLKVITGLQHNVEEYKMQLLKANEVIVQQAPKVEYVNKVLEAPNLIPITIIAKDLGMSAAHLNKLLNKRGIIFRQGETWVLYSKYQAMGFTHTKTHTYFDSEGRTKTSIQTFWTEKGRKFIHELLDKALKIA